MTLVVAFVAAVFIGRWWRRKRGAASTARSTERIVPDLVELLVVLVRAGLTPALAVRRLAAVPPPDPFGPAVDAVVARLDAGERFTDALVALTDAHGAILEPLVSLLVRAERYGDPLEPILERLATDARDDRRRAAELRARRLPVQLSVPLVCCTLPAFVVLTIVPMLLGTFSSFTDLQP